MTTTPITANTLTLVADPRRTGLTIIPTSTPLTRLNYYDGKFLRADDLRLDQTYARLLVSLSVRGGGSGVVHGFELYRAGTGDGLLLRAGLAVTPSGRVVYLPADASFRLAQLLSKSGEGSFDPGAPPAPGPAGFAPCAVPEDDGPDVALTPQPAYIVTVTADEALCGEEERFGELCGDACLTDVDRPRRVEGVRVRARRLDLAGLPQSSQVPFTALHYRSRVATAYFGAEARRIPSLLSAAGLASGAWCDGADPAAGDEVPIALLAVRGTALEFIDLWAARRELMVEPARRYWAMRMAMRPWDVFLAHVLQFQCQLRDALTTGGGTKPPTDPCAGERSALRDLHHVITDMSGRLEGLEVAKADRDRWRTLAVKAAVFLVPAAAPTSGSLLIDRGIVTTPSAGYLPVDPAGDVVAQVRAQFGPGVDLRFCAAAADVLPHLLEQAQHMERVSLTAGLDDPSAKPAVDVVIPDGRVTTDGAPSSPVYSGTLLLVPRARATGLVGAVPNPSQELGYAMQLRAVCRDVDGPGWNWALAAYGEAAQGLAVERLLLALAAPLIRTEGREPAAPGGRVIGGSAGNVTIVSSLAAAKRTGAERMVLAANRERVLAVNRRAVLSGRTVSGAPAVIAIPPDRALARDEARPVALWVDVRLDAPLEAAPAGAVARGTVVAAIYSRAATNPVLIHLRLDGMLRVRGRAQEASPDGAPETVVTTDFDGVVDPLVVTDEEHDTPPQSFRTTLLWRFGRDAYGRPTLLALVDTEARVVPAFEANAPADGLRRAAVGVMGRPGALGEPVRLLDVGEEWSAQSRLVAASIPSTQVLASVELERDDTALDVGRPARDLAEAAVESIGAELSPADRDPQFTGRARQLMFPATTAGSTKITPRRTWVMFHRRRIVTCTDQLTPVQLGIRRYRAYHATVASRDELAGFDALLAATGPRLDNLGFQLVSVLEFREGDAALLSSPAAVRVAWTAAPRGSELLWQGGGDIGTGDGDEVLVRRIDSYRSALAGLIDAAGVGRPVVMTAIPQEFTGVGTDGALFTIGLAVAPTPPAPPEPEITRATHRALPMTGDQFKRLLDRLRALGDDLARVPESALRNLLAPLNIPADLLDIEFENDALPDQTAKSIIRWWTATGNDRPPARAELFVDARVVAETGTTPEEKRAAIVLELLGGQAPSISRTFGPIDGARAIVAYIRD